MELYRDFYGCTACIRKAKSGGARLTVRTPGGELFHAKDYNTYRGAKIAMGRMSESWSRR